MIAWHNESVPAPDDVQRPKSVVVAHDDAMLMEEVPDIFPRTDTNYGVSGLVLESRKCGYEPSGQGSDSEMNEIIASNLYTITMTPKQ